MNHKQKLGYTLFGAGIMALGITIGQVITPQLEAQSNGVFDEIVCTKLTVVNKEGKQVVILGSREYTLWDSENPIGQNGVWIYDNEGNETIALQAEDAGSRIIIYDKEGYYAAKLDSVSGINSVWINHKEKSKIGFVVDELSPSIVIERNGKITWSAP